MYDGSSSQCEEVAPARDSYNRPAHPHGLDKRGATIDRNVLDDDRFERALAILACGLVLFGTGLFLIDGLRDRISADAAVPLLLARHMLETRTWLPSDWYFGNGDIWIAGPQLFVLPFVAAWGAVPRALACGNALGLALLFVSVVALARASGARWTTALIAACLPVALYSHFQREFVVVQLSYGLMAAKLMLALAAAIAWLRAPPDRAARGVLVAYVALLAIWTAENPARPLAFLVVPLGVAMALHRAPAQRAVVLGSATFIALGAGWIMRQWWVTRLQIVPGLDAFRFTAPAEWVAHGRSLAAGLRYVYGVDALGVPQIASIVATSLAVLRAAAFPAIGLWVLRVGSDRDARTPLVVGAVGLVLIAALLIVGNAMVDPVSDRYLLPPWLLATMGAVLAARALRSWRAIAVLLVIAFPLGGALNAIGIWSAGSTTDAAGLPGPPALDGAIAAIRETGIARGFATHRYANVATVRSDAELEICDVHWLPTVEPARWLDAATCFEPARYAGGFFVLLAPDERDAAHASAVTATIGTPTEMREADGYAIWLYRGGSGDLGWLAR